MQKSENFLQGFVRLYDDTEIPPVFALWAGISGVSAVLGRQVWVEMGGLFTIYPNFYIVFVAGSGRCRKSTAIGQISKILHGVDPKPNIIAQKVTAEALIDAMRIQEVTGDKKIIREVCTGVVLADELYSFLNKTSYEAGLPALLIQLYDCVNHYEYRTKSGGRQLVQNSCLSILGGTTIEWIRNAVPEDAVGGGLTSRMIFIYVDKPAPPVPFPSMSLEKRQLYEDLVRRLNQIALLSGQMSISPEALAYYEEVYRQRYYNDPMNNDRDLSGYASRRAVHMVKLSMVFAAAELATTIQIGHMRGADLVLCESEKFMRPVMDLITSSQGGSLVKLVLRQIATRSPLSRADLMRTVSHRLTSAELDEIIRTLSASDLIQVEFRGRQTWYSLNPERSTEIGKSTP